MTQDSFGTADETLGEEIKTSSTSTPSSEEASLSDNGTMVDCVSLPGLTSVLYAGNTKKGWTESNPLKPNQDSFLWYDVSVIFSPFACDIISMYSDRLHTLFFTCFLL